MLNYYRAAASGFRPRFWTSRWRACLFLLLQPPRADCSPGYAVLGASFDPTLQTQRDTIGRLHFQGPGLLLDRKSSVRYPLLHALTKVLPRSAFQPRLKKFPYVI